jgi:hypothetical protein
MSLQKSSLEAKTCIVEHFPGSERLDPGSRSASLPMAGIKPGLDFLPVRHILQLFIDKFFGEKHSLRISEWKFMKLPGCRPES